MNLFFKRATTITWANPADIIHGTALSGTQLDATASVPGTFTYIPAAGTVLGVGNGQTLAVVFTPADSTDYTGAYATVAINVRPPLLRDWSSIPTHSPAARGAKSAA